MKATYGLKLYLRDFNTCFLVNITTFLDSKPLEASVDLVFSVKSNVEWFLLKRVDMVIVRVRMINLQKPKPCPK